MPEFSKTLPVTKRWAARVQLETAIWLWFNHWDPVSIHTLAAASNECYNAIGKHEGKPSQFQTWINNQTPEYRDQLRYAQNFFKHERDLNKTLSYNPVHGELLMFDSVMCHSALHGSPTSPMSAFAILWASNNPIARAVAPIPLITGLPLHTLEELQKTLERPELFKRLLEIIGP